MLDNFESYMEDSPMKTFGEIYKLQNLIKKPTCFKSQENNTCIDLVSKVHMICNQRNFVIYFVNIEISVLHFRKNLKRIILQI